jgi:hypothetical protein
MAGQRLTGPRRAAGLPAGRARRAAGSAVPAVGVGRFASSLAGGALLAATVALLLAPALWNGFPLVYFDSEDYVTMAFTWQPIIWRTMPYALIVATARGFGSLWAPILLQALITAWVLHEFVSAFVPRRRPAVLFALALVLTLFTGLPWVTSQLLADAFTGIVPIGIATLAFGAPLSRGRTICLALCVTVAIAVHMSHVAVAAGLLICLLLLQLGHHWFARRLPRPRLAAATLAIVVGIASVPAVHLAVTGEAYFSRSGRVLQLALLVQDDLAQRYLREVCSTGTELRLCPYREHLKLTADGFLWDPWNSPFDDLGGWSAMLPEAEVIVPGVIARYPGAVLQAAALNTLRQLGMVRSGDGLSPKRPPEMALDSFLTVLQARFPGEEGRFLTAQQQQGAGIRFSALNLWQVPVAMAAQIGLVALLLAAWQRGDRATCGLALIVLLALLGNAVVCGAISNPHDRYQNRIVWIAVAGCGVVAARWWQFRRGTTAHSLRT